MRSLPLKANSALLAERLTTNMGEGTNSWLQGAGYRSAPRGRFDPLNQAASASSGSLDQKSEASPEETCLEAEAKVHTALEQSAEALAKGDSAAGTQFHSTLQTCAIQIKLLMCISEADICCMWSSPQALVTHCDFDVSKWAQYAAPLPLGPVCWCPVLHVCSLEIVQQLGRRGWAILQGSRLKL